MRVVSGKYRGKKLKEFDISSTRPTLDRVKEAMFNLIQFDVQNSVVLDLFSGTGALGLEAISRGAKITYLIDSNAEAIKLIKQNLANVTEQYKLIKEDAITFLNKCNLKFDIVLLDPPFNSNLGIEAINIIIKNNMLNNNGIIVFETSIDKPFVLEHKNYSVKFKKYGSVALYKISKEEE